MYKQVIICRRDLGMTPGKLGAQISHASMAFLTNQIRNNSWKVANEEGHSSWEWIKTENGMQKIARLYRREDLSQWAKESFEQGEYKFYTKLVDPLEPNGRLELCSPTYSYKCNLKFDDDLYEQWISGSFTKVVLEAKNKNHLLKAKTMAEEIGMKENEDYFLIKDNCYTELEPEEIDENGVGRTLTCIGFAPMDSEIIDKIGKKYQLYK